MTDEEFAEVQRKGHAARTLLSDETFQAVGAEVLDALKAEWLDADTPERREELHAEAQGLARLQARMKSWADDAKFETERRAKRDRRA